MTLGNDGAMLLLRKELLLEQMRHPRRVALLDEMPPCRPRRSAAPGRMLLHRLGHSLMILGQRLEGYAAIPLAAGKQ